MNLEGKSQTSFSKKKPELKAEARLHVIPIMWKNLTEKGFSDKTCAILSFLKRMLNHEVSEILFSLHMSTCASRLLTSCNIQDISPALWYPIVHAVLRAETAE